MEYIIYLIVAMVAYWLGWHARGLVFLSNISQRPDHMIKMLEKIKEINESEDLGLPEDAIEVQTETVNGLVYAYEKASGQFLSQAQNLHQAMMLAAARFPGKKFWHPELKQDHQTA
jgi:hypothetical protein